MKSSIILSIAAFAPVALAANEAHGAGAQGSEMGPVAFLWPADRPWSANSDNIGPCGSQAGITSRTEFPIGCLSFTSLAPIPIRY